MGQFENNELSNPLASERGWDPIDFSVAALLCYEAKLNSVPPKPRHPPRCINYTDSDVGRFKLFWTASRYGFLNRYLIFFVGVEPFNEPWCIDYLCARCAVAVRAAIATIGGNEANSQEGVYVPERHYVVVGNCESYWRWA